MWFSGLGGVEWVVGLDDVRGLFQSMILEIETFQSGSKFSFPGTNPGSLQ